MKKAGLNQVPARKFFGMPTKFENNQSESLILSPGSSQTATSRQSTQHILLAWNFEVQKLTEKYYGSSDYLQDLGGYGFFLCCIIYVLAALLVIIYLVDLVKLIQHKYQEQERSLEIDNLLRKLPYFKKVVEAEIESGFSEDLKKDLQDIDKLLDKKKTFFDDSYGLFLLKDIQFKEEEKPDSQQMEGGQKVEK